LPRRKKAGKYWVPPRVLTTQTFLAIVPDLELLQRGSTTAARHAHAGPSLTQKIGRPTHRSPGEIARQRNPKRAGRPCRPGPMAPPPAYQYKNGQPTKSRIRAAGAQRRQKLMRPPPCAQLPPEPAPRSRTLAVAVIRSRFLALISDQGSAPHHHHRPT